MNCTITRQKDFTRGQWSGGKTTELFLFPAGTAYAARDFSVRASTATVEQTTSLFTELPGYRRLIMLLAGDLRLVHEGRYDVELAPHQVEAFDGGWHTRSFGRCTDFNLMLAAGWQGALLPLHGGDSRPCAAITGLYALADTIATVSGGGTTQTDTLHPGDLLLIENGGNLETTSDAGGVCAVLFTARQTENNHE